MNDFQHWAGLQKAAEAARAGGRRRAPSGSQAGTLGKQLPGVLVFAWDAWKCVPGWWTAWPKRAGREKGIKGETANPLFVSFEGGGGGNEKNAVKFSFASSCFRFAVEELFVCLTPVSGTLEKLLHVEAIPDEAHSASVLYGKFIRWLNKLLCHKLNEKCISLYLKVRCRIGNLSFICHTDVYGKFVIDGIANK